MQWLGGDAARYCHSTNETGMAASGPVTRGSRVLSFKGRDHRRHGVDGFPTIAIGLVGGDAVKNPQTVGTRRGYTEHCVRAPPYFYVR